MEKNIGDLTNEFRTNFYATPFRNIFNLFLIRLHLHEEEFNKLLILSEDILFLMHQSPYASIQRILITPPPPKPLTMVMFGDAIVKEMTAREQMGAIAHEVAHILAGHYSFAFFDRHEPEPDYKAPAVIVEGEGEEVTDLKIISAKDFTEQMDLEADGIAMSLGFTEEIKAMRQFIGKKEGRKKS